MRTADGFLPVNGQSRSRHRRDSTDTTRLLTAVSGRSSAFQLRAALLTRECLLADWHRLHMLAVTTPHLRTLLVRFSSLGHLTIFYAYLIFYVL